MNSVNQKLIDAIIRKANLVCPDSLALIGIYGSCATGDLHPKSDLDLLILIQDEKGYELASTFILENVGIGYDLYCTNWTMLEEDANCDHAHLSKLLDSRIVFVNDESALPRLEALKAKAQGILNSDARYEKAIAALNLGKQMYCECFLDESISELRTHAGAVIHQLLDAVMLYHGRYFRKGVKRTFSEIGELALPFNMEEQIMTVILGENRESIRNGITVLFRNVRNHLRIPQEKQIPCEKNLGGSYEEMVSNWRNKMVEAACNDDLFSSYMNMVSCQFMLQEIEESVDIAHLDMLAGFDPGDLSGNAAYFDHILEKYLCEYKKAGIEPNKYKDVESFVKHYL